MLSEGWPHTIKSTPEAGRPYWTFKEEVVQNDNALLMKGSQIIIPKALRKDMLKRIHEGHLGMQMAKQRARESVYWPKMNQQIDWLIQSCSTCQKHRNSQSKETLMCHSVPENPFDKIGADLFSFGNHTYLLMVDYTTKYFECNLLRETTSASVITSMKTTPKQLERSPAELLMGRKLRTLLPTVLNKIVRPTSVTHAHQQKQASYYNNHTKDLKQLQQLQFVRYRNQRTWEPAQVLQRLGDRSYLIKTKNGTYRRNRRDLRETTETFDLSRPDPFEFDVQLPQSATSSTTYATPSTQTESQNSSDQQAETTKSAHVTEPPVTNATHNTTMQYTRSGRVVKPPQKLTL
ncbi:hypothetical protein RRG08_035482 [Elysia crispata]|uniref:Integrase zinc-binding domain-containing protein n=1 Tax=Elysia crispata TaxID=231223 RepID=A0AAE1AQB5_9GAST|nr:hypothetical protein RRG08_035482 [Elysia crispata]